MRSNRGFTLIELMVVVAIVAILAAIAVPAYTGQVRRSHRADALSGSTDLQLRQERYRANHASYATSMDVLLGSAAATSSFNSSHPYYNFAISGASATGYTVTANAEGDQASDTACNPMTAAMAAGVMTKTPTEGRCWN